MAYKILCLLYPRLYKYKHHFIVTDPPKFKGCIATQSQCFPLHQHFLRVIGLPFEKVDLGYTPDCILSIDPMYLYCELDTVKKIYLEVENFFKKKGYSTVAYKFHPSFEAESNKEIKQKFNAIIHNCFTEALVELQPQIVLENIFMSYQCDFYSDYSSVGIYAHGMGATCYTLSPIIKKYVPSFGQKTSNLIRKYYVDIAINEIKDKH